MDRNEFLKRRKQGIGGSDIAAIVGLSPWRTPRDIYMDKTGQSEPEQETEAMYWGTTLEDVVAKEYSKRTGRKIQRCNVLFQHPEHPFMIGNIDRAVYDEPGKMPVVKGEFRAKRGLECKTASQYAASDWGAPGTEDIPEYYKAQVMWYMMLTGAEVWDVAVLIGNRDFRIYEIQRNGNVIEYLRAEGVKFWTGYVQAGVMPPPVSLEDIEALHHGTPKARAFATDDITAKVERYREIDEQIKELKAEQEPLKMAICDHIGDAVELVTPDARKLCTWSVAKPTSKTDWKAVAEEMKATDEVIAKHTTEALSARRFAISTK